MLKYLPFAYHVTGKILLIVLILSGCRVHFPSAVRLEEQRSDVQRLLVTNHLKDPIKLVANDPEQPTLSVQPGETVTMQFFVATIVELKRSGDAPWYQRKQGTNLNELLPDNLNRFLTQKGEDVLIQVETSDGTRWTFLFSLGDCWYDQVVATHEHVLEITGQPMAGIPIELCP